MFCSEDTSRRAMMSNQCLREIWIALGGEPAALPSVSFSARPKLLSKRRSIAAWRPFGVGRV